MGDLMTGEEQNASGSEETTETSEETTEQQTDQTTETEDSSGEQTETSEEKPEGAPEQYADFTMPEGMDVDSAALETYAPVFKDLNLTQGQAQALVDLRAQEVQAQNQALMDHVTERDNTWLKDLEQDKEIGGENLGANMVKVNKVLATFDKDKELVNFLKETQTQNCAPLVKLLARIAPHFSEDVLVTGGEKTKKDVAMHNRMGWKPLDEY